MNTRGRHVDPWWGKTWRTGREADLGLVLEHVEEGAEDTEIKHEHEPEQDLRSRAVMSELRRRPGVGAFRNDCHSRLR